MIRPRGTGWRAAWPVAGLLALAALPAAAVRDGSVVTAERFADRYSWAVAIHSEESGGWCTGQVVAPRWVLTAAHCAAENKIVVAGHRDVRRGRRIAVTRVIRHPRYDRDTGAFDIGLLELAEDAGVPAVRVATRGEMLGYLLLKRPAELAGWGKTGPGAPFSPLLRAAAVNVAGTRVRGPMLLTDDGRAGLCAGDSGGPLLLNDEAGSWILAGVASRTEDGMCARRATGKRALYVNAPAIRDFLDAVLTPVPEPG